MEKLTARRIDEPVIDVVVNRETIRSEPRTLITIPKMPPAMLNSEDSIRNWTRISRSRAPSALRMPISRVRSVTETSMIFMIPVSYTHLRAHETRHDLVCRLLLEK